LWLFRSFDSRYQIVGEKKKNGRNIGTRYMSGLRRLGSPCHCVFLAFLSRPGRSRNVERSELMEWTDLDHGVFTQ